MERIKLIATNDRPYRTGGQEFSRPASDAERLINFGWAVLPEDWIPTDLTVVLPRPISLVSQKRTVKKANDKKVSVYMATFPGRKRCLEDSIPSLINQCDEFNLWLNGYKETDKLPEICYHEKVKRHYGQDVGDIGKFMHCHNWQGYVLTCDDKLIYAPDYVAKMVAKVEQYDRKAVISAHGRILNHPCKRYYFDAKAFHGCMENVKSDVWVEEIGTGAMCLHASTVMDFRIEELNITNMTDILFSIWLNAHKIPRLVIAHDRGWIQGSINLKPPSISTTHNKDDKLHTEIINAVKWEIHEPAN